MSALNAFTVDARATEKTGDGKVTATIKSSTGKKVNSFVENKNDGTYKVKYILPEEGKFLALRWVATNHWNSTIIL